MSFDVNKRKPSATPSDAESAMERWMTAAREGDLQAIASLASGAPGRAPPRRLSLVDPLMVACMVGQDEGAMAIMDRFPHWASTSGRGVARPDANGSLALHHAAASSASLSVAMRLCEADPSALALVNFLGESPSKIAKRCGHGVKAEFLERRALGKLPQSELDYFLFLAAFEQGERPDPQSPLGQAWAPGRAANTVSDVFRSGPWMLALRADGEGAPSMVEYLAGRCLELRARDRGAWSRESSNALAAMRQAALRGWGEAVGSIWESMKFQKVSDLESVARAAAHRGEANMARIRGLIQSLRERRGLEQDIDVPSAPSAKTSFRM